MSTFSFLTAAARQADTGSTLYGILYFVFMSAVILGAAYYVTKYIAKRGFKASGNKNLKIVESVSLGIDKSLMLVKVGEQYLLLGSTQKSISMLAEIDQEKLSTGNTNGVYGNLDGEGAEAYMTEFNNENERSGMNSVKNNLNKLKSIVRGNKSDG